MNKLTVNALVSLWLVSSVCTPVLAKNFGQIGMIYPIKEENLLHVIYSRLDRLNTPLLQEDLIKKVEQQVRRPTPVSGITKATHLHEWDVDPTLVVSTDIVNHKGQIVVKAGTHINPLNHMTLHSVLFFYDADDALQVAWVTKQQIQAKKKRQLSKLILVNGDVGEQQRQFNQDIYFDQGGRLTTQFHITHVPARLAQQGDHLHVIEGGL